MCLPLPLAPGPIDCSDCILAPATARPFPPAFFVSSLVSRFARSILGFVVDRSRCCCRCSWSSCFGTREISGCVRACLKQEGVNTEWTLSSPLVQPDQAQNRNRHSKVEPFSGNRSSSEISRQTIFICSRPKAFAAMALALASQALSYTTGSLMAAAPNRAAVNMGIEQELGATGPLLPYWDPLGMVRRAPLSAARFPIVAA